MLPVRDVVRCIRDVALALNYAHRQKVLHRDLKPENIMLDKANHRAVVMDFGLAALLSDSERLTWAGTILGTLPYLSPEQVKGHSEPRSDIYSLGVILYELLSGVRPFQEHEGDDADLMVAIESAFFTPPSGRRDGVDPELEAICLKAMASHADQRYQSMSLLARALTAYLRRTKSSRSRGPSAEMETVEHTPSTVLTSSPRAITPFNSESARKHQELWAAFLGFDRVWENCLGMQMSVTARPGLCV